MNNLSVKTVTQFSVTLNHVPGEMAKVTSALATAGVNVEAACHTSESASSATLRLVVDKNDVARTTLVASGNAFVEEEVLSVMCPKNKPGVLAMMGKALGDAGINIEDTYYTSAGAEDTAVCLQVGKENLTKASSIIVAL